MARRRLMTFGERDHKQPLGYKDDKVVREGSDELGEKVMASVPEVTCTECKDKFKSNTHKVCLKCRSLIREPYTVAMPRPPVGYGDPIGPAANNLGSTSGTW